MTTPNLFHIWISKIFNDFKLYYNNILYKLKPIYIYISKNDYWGDSFGGISAHNPVKKYTKTLPLCFQGGIYIYTPLKKYPIYFNSMILGGVV